MRWYPTARARGLATAALLALAAAVLTGHAALVLLAAPALGALALMPRRNRHPELDIDVALSGSRCFEGENVTITATVRAAAPVDEVILEPEVAPQAALVGAGPGAQTFLRAGRASARWVIRPDRWGRYSPATVLVTARAGEVIPDLSAVH